MEQEWVSVREAGRRRGVRHRAVQKAIESKRIPEACVRRENGRVVAVEYHGAMKAWDANTDPVEAERNGKFPAAPPPVQQQLVPPTQPSEKQQQPAEPGDQANFLAARLRESELRGQMLELDKLERVGAIAPVADLESDSIEIFAELKNAVLRVPGRKAQTLAGETDALRIERALSDELRKVFDEFSNRLTRMAEQPGLEAPGSAAVV